MGLFYGKDYLRGTLSAMSRVGFCREEQLLALGFFSALGQPGAVLLPLLPTPEGVGVMEVTLFPGRVVPWHACSWVPGLAFPT